jgi:hypothetical protein
MDELKRIKEVVENYKNKYPEKHVKTCMLVWEDCMPSCPFKREHDDLQIYSRKISYWSSHLGALTCKTWWDISGETILPRSRTNCFWSSIDTFEEYAQLVDIFKYSGRLTISIPQRGDLEWGLCREPFAVKSFSEIIENRLEPVHLWVVGTGIFPRLKTDMEKIKEHLKDNFWLTDEGKRLEQRLKNCKNQCYNCHLCERTFRLPNIDSLIEI